MSNFCKESRLRELSAKDRIDTDVLLGFLEHPTPETDGTVPEDLYYGILDAMILDADSRDWELWQLNR